MNGILREYKKTSKKYLDNIEYFNYPGKIFYISGSFYWLTDQLTKFYGVSLPFVFVHVKDGKASWEIPISLGPSQKVIKEIKAKGLEFIRQDKKNTNKVLNKFEHWLKQNPIQPNKSLVYYLDLLDKAYKILLDTNIYLQVSSHINYLLDKNLTKVFSPDLLSAEELWRQCLPKEKAFVNVHEEQINNFIKWINKKKLKLTKKNFSSFIKNKDFNKYLEKCYSLGYFLHSSYGGVTLWNKQDEYNYLVDEFKNKNKKNKIKNIIKKSLTAKQSLWIKASQHFSYQRDIRKKIHQKSFYYQALLLEKISHFTNFTRNELEYLRKEQITIKNLSDKKKLKTIIKKQKKDLLFCWVKNKGGIYISGDKATKIYKKYSSLLKLNEGQLQGQTACKGIAKGKVKIIFNTHQKTTFKKGNVLVTGMTAPNFLPLMKKASAIITEQGGVTCHAAIISRELNIPCIIGTKVATKVLKDGDLVEVDANKGIIKLLK